MKYIVLMFLSMLPAGSVLSQGLPPPSRTVYRCEEAGKIRYSDSPCIGARRIDVEPTRGFDRSTGKELVGQDVRTERNREMFAEAIRPLTGMDARQLDKAGRRMKLPPDAQRECQRLDREIPLAEQAERRALQPYALAAARETLHGLRTKFRQSRCE